MNRKASYITIAALSLTCVFLFIYAVVEKKSLDQQYRELFAANYRIFAPELPKKIDFAGEQTPLNNVFVRESLEREILASTFMHSSTILMLKRANRWFPVIEPILKKNGIPDDFKYLAIAESNFANVVSPSGAEGFWQFLKPTGQKYGLEINEEVDERYNVVKATEAACKYFREAYDLYHNWTLVAASFNRGMAGMNKAIEGQLAGSFYDLWLNDETARYIYRILAIKQVYTHPVKYGVYLREKDLYPPIPTYSISIDSSISNLALFAKKQETTYKVLREFNPWIQRYNLPNKTGKTYVFLLPVQGMLKTDTLYKSLPGKNTFFNDTLTIQDLH